MEICYLDSVDSTQKYLIEQLKSGILHSPCAVSAKIQYSGSGSRGNSWQGLDGNLFFSFSLKISDLVDDIKLESASIYFAYILKLILEDLGSSCWLKWPNDFYLKDKKIGGVITNIYKENIICGIGMNLMKAPEEFAILDIDIEKNYLIKLYLNELLEKYSWKYIVSKYEIEFYKNKNYITHNKDEEISLKDANLLYDGSLEIDGKRIFSLR